METSIENETKVRRLKATLCGAVQGVGFRPFVYRLAKELGLKGSVANSSHGLLIEVEGPLQALQSFLDRVEKDRPPHASIQSFEKTYLDPIDLTDLKITESDSHGEKTAFVLPDIATCDECLQDILDSSNRRYQYPFTNCTHCGPRFSIVESLPYDRKNTSMKQFTMCDDCQKEYDDAANRRYHAQPNACPRCGPNLELWDSQGNAIARYDEALYRAAEAITAGRIVAVKGLGGFHLLADATNEEAVRTLRERKGRDEKPFAVMVASVMEAAKHCEISKLEERMLGSPQAPIVLLKKKKKDTALAPSIAPNNPMLGLLLPYTGLHHLLLRKIKRPVVATSGNLSEEPIVTDEKEAVRRLKSIVHFFLVHNRPIVRPVDDSVLRVVADRELVLRRARGFAPMPIAVDRASQPVLGVGAQLKSTLSFAIHGQAFVSQHIGDLQNKETLQAFKEAARYFETMYERKPSLVSTDLHPGYLSSELARQWGVPRVEVQHHYAHALSCMAENELKAPIFAIAWDGTGYGEDGTLWGGEFLEIDEIHFTRRAFFRRFLLPGGEKAIVDPRRCALGVLYEIFGNQVFSMSELEWLSQFTQEEKKVLKAMLERNVASFVTSSAGRLFDAVAALLGISYHNHFEGQSAMALEFAKEDMETDEHYPVHFYEESAGGKLFWVYDWEAMIRGILSDRQYGLETSLLSVKFHNTLVEAAVRAAQIAEADRVLLTGGCFQNKYLVERCVRRLTEEGIRPYWHQRVPPNDGGLCLGQVVAAIRSFKPCV